MNVIKCTPNSPSALASASLVFIQSETEATLENISKLDKFEDRHGEATFQSLAK